MMVSGKTECWLFCSTDKKEYAEFCEFMDDLRYLGNHYVIEYEYQALRVVAKKMPLDTGRNLELSASDTVFLGDLSDRLRKEFETYKKTRILG